MSANFHGTRFRLRRRLRPWPQQRPAQDGDITTDVHEEFTADLDPSTADIVPSEVVPSEVPRSQLASAPQPVPSSEPQEPARPVSVAPIVARPPESPVDSASPIVAREVSASNTPPVLETVVAASLPLGRREPFVSEPAPAPAPVAPTLRVTGEPTLDVQNQGNGKPIEAKPLTAEPVARKPIPLQAVEQQRPALAPGKVLCDRYLLEQVIGCGGTAIVFRARDMLSAKGAAPNTQVAIKTPRPELGDPARAAMRLKHEFEHAKLLSHPSIVRVHELHEDDGRCFMTMELVQGKLLSQLLRDWTMMPVPLAYKVLNQCAEALEYAHSQEVVHGDFKPGNVFITPEEGVRIVDFGTAAGPNTSDSRIPAGTPTYASPEVLGGDTPDRRDDVFSFACVAYELLTGQHPFGRQSSLQARDEGKIPPRAWNLSTSQWLSLLSALSWKREQRPTSVAELLTRLNPDKAEASAPAPILVDPEEVVPAELPADLMPKQRSWGFFAFIACALLVTYFAFTRQNAVDDGEAPTAPMIPAAQLPPVPAPETAAQPAQPEAASPSTIEDTKPETTAPAAAAAPAVAAKPRATAAPMSEISFESSNVVTSESSVAAVFLIKRSQPLSGRVSVSWKTISGTADAGIDFASAATGTVTFADGQAQRAIYVPLRNDLLKEDDETFYVELISPKGAKLGKTARAEAIIRDDD